MVIDPINARGIFLVGSIASSPANGNSSTAIKNHAANTNDVKIPYDPVQIVANR